MKKKVVLALAILVGACVLAWGYSEIKSVDEMLEEEMEIDVSQVDMSSITKPSVRYVNNGALEDGNGIYQKKDAFLRDNIDLGNCRLDSDSQPDERIYELQQLVLSGAEKQLWSRYLKTADKDPVNADESEQALDEFVERIKAGQRLFVVNQVSVDNGVMITFFLMRECEKTAFGRLYDYQNAFYRTFTFFDGTERLFVPYAMPQGLQKQ